VVSSCEHGDEPSGSIKCRECLECTLSFSRRTLLHGVSLVSYWLVIWYVGWLICRLVGWLIIWLIS
jgi:hypothetical protein